MARALASTLRPSDHTARNLAYMYTALFVVIGLEFYLAIGEIKMPDVVKSTLDTLLGVLITMVTGSKEYFFGSSSRADKQADRITQFAVSPDITVTGGPIDQSALASGSVNRTP
ncbi:hypothetical protein [Burkholderia ubonensis]|uniref:hypothetical protein n=1 Tax=Burkholderia ubonensis TaxID=101571 RepID=UPI00210D6005|nr:hypothetical protein [Burkholderia ubonensis]